MHARFIDGVHGVQPRDLERHARGGELVDELAEGRVFLRGPADEEGTLFISHTLWNSREEFEAWTCSAEFRKAHGQAREGQWERAVREATDLEQFERASRVGRPIVAGRGRSPITVRRGGILDYQRAELVQLIQWIQSDDVSRTEDEVLAAACDVLGLPDSSGRVERALRAAIKEAQDIYS